MIEYTRDRKSLPSLVLKYKKMAGKSQSMSYFMQQDRKEIMLVRSRIAIGRGTRNRDHDHI